MGLTKEQLKAKAIAQTIKYVKEHGNSITDSIYVGDYYPICIKDKCVTAVAVIDGIVQYGDLSSNKKSMHNLVYVADVLERKYIEDALADMTAYGKRTKR